MTSRTAIFIIDVQAATANTPASRVPHADRLKSVLSEILSAARTSVPKNDQEAPIIVFVQHSQHPEDGPLVYGTAPWELVFTPEDDSSNEFVVHKTTGDTFESNQDLAARLRSHGVTHVVTLGIQSEYCVQATALGALSAGFQVSILEDAHSTYNAGDATALGIEKEVEKLIVSRGGKSRPYKTALSNWVTSGKVM
ncbi:hypothetical protein VHEMI01703 [[Torrubiella] hemipterigena]|uniref:Isochorismatase-like domain-containing protein n=1 Tax=[Torrubiella] hemipterigena TaxID=1531966 RepID=A0A0A1T5L2_9HYPO|nr:hypothetical protein VHEMI01703 [[Torrubiella] hemipterigena]